MMRRVWPAILAILALAVFGSYILYTRYLAHEISKALRVNAAIYTVVQKGLTQPQAESLAFGSLFEVQAQLRNIDIPIVVFNASGQIVTAGNIPDHPEISGQPHNAQQDSIARFFAARENLRNRESRVIVEGAGEVTFGDSPLLRKLKWVPWFQTAAGLLLLLFLFTILRSDHRAEQERMYAAMARELAHQMGTPLSSLAGWVEVLQLPESQRAGFTSTDRIGDVMHADVERLERVSRRFELIGKPQALELVALSDVVNELDSYFRPRLPHLGRGIRLRTVVQSNMPPIRANRVLLVWAVENIVKNAVDALAGRGGKIIIAAHGDGKGAVHLHVADNGPGIDAKVRDRIFVAGVSTKSSGWGVGLSLTRRIIEDLHSGKVSARSRASGGTVFDIILPTADAAASKATLKRLKQS